jgi:hypothetical protein
MQESHCIGQAGSQNEDEDEQYSVQETQCHWIPELMNQLKTGLMIDSPLMEERRLNFRIVLIPE